MLPRVVYQFWDGKMSDVRRDCFEKSRTVFGVPVELITPDNLADYIIPEHPLHPCWPFLSPIHKSDYLRCYLLRFRGGGYADIKEYGQDNNWCEQFDLLDRTPYADLVGEPENPRWAAFPTYCTKTEAQRLVVCGYMIGKADTPFTRMWYGRVTRYLDFLEPAIRRHPSPAEGQAVGYPIPYYGVQGYQFHYTCHKFAEIRPNAVLRSLRSGRLFTPYR